MLGLDMIQHLSCFSLIWAVQYHEEFKPKNQIEAFGTPNVSPRKKKRPALTAQFITDCEWLHSFLRP